MSEVVIYQNEQSQTQVSVRMDGETVWLTQRQMADLFDTSADNISLHLKNVFSEGELGEPATTEDFSVAQTEGRRKVTRTVKHYNLDAIISVGYRVNSRRGVQFRQWATRVGARRMSNFAKSVARLLQLTLSTSPPPSDQVLGPCRRDLR
jgi:hypothetical protein